MSKVPHLIAGAVSVRARLLCIGAYRPCDEVPAHLPPAGLLWLLCKHNLVLFQSTVVGNVAHSIHLWTINLTTAVLSTIPPQVFFPTPCGHMHPLLSHELQLLLRPLQVFQLHRSQACLRDLANPEGVKMANETTGSSPNPSSGDRNRNIHIWRR